MLNKGYFISFEGIDGCGKTTQIKKTLTYLNNKNKEAIKTREPGGTKIGEKIRSILLGNENNEMDYRTEALLYAASRAQHVNELIKPALLQKKIVVSDRFIHSSLIYQGIGRELGIEKIAEINEFALCGCMPDLSIFLDISNWSFR